MKKKNRQKREKSREDHTAGREREGSDKEKKDDAGRVDYGGLPDRDLKKNLGGCG